MLDKSRAWEKRNPERTKYLRARGSARTFVRHYATPEDMDELYAIFQNENPNALEEDS